MAFPEEFIKRIDTQKYIDTGSLVKSLEEPSPVSIRINPGKWPKTPAASEPVEWCQTGFYLQSRPSFTLDPLFHSGCYYPREASGMFIEQVFARMVDSSEKLRVLDLCAAPGGKSTQISDLIGKNSLLIANEVIRSRAAILVETISKWGRANTIVTRNDPSEFKQLGGYFDVILVDAPCSGEGMFRDSNAVNEWSVANTNLCRERQKRILTGIWPSLKENGLLIYSTCTFNPGENEENIKWLVENNKAECLRMDVKEYPGIQEIDFEGIYGYGFYPGNVRGEGFFLSVIRKKESTIPVHQNDRRRKVIIPGKNDMTLAGSWINQRTDNILLLNDSIILSPVPVSEYMFLSGVLNFQSRGTLIATKKQSDYLPSHDLVLSQVIKDNAFPAFNVDYHNALFYLRRDNLKIDGLHNGWNILTFKGVKLGLVKNIGKRINNYFPVEWRIRMNLPQTGTENIIRWQDEH